MTCLKHRARITNAGGVIHSGSTKNHLFTFFSYDSEFQLSLCMLKFLAFHCSPLLIYCTFGLVHLSQAQSSKGQTRIAELEQVLAEEEMDDQAYSELLLELISLHEELRQFEAMADRSIAYSTLSITQENAPDLKKNTLKKSLRYEQNILDSNTVGNLYLKLASVYFNTDQLDSATHFYSEALEKFSPSDTLFLADAYFFRGQVKDSNNDMISAMLDYQKALDLYESAGDEAYANFVRGGMAILFSKYEIYTEAEAIRQDIIRRYEERKDWVNLGIQYFNRGTELGKEGKTPLQLKNFLIADSLIQLGNSDNYLLVQSSFALSRAYAQTDDIAAQRAYFDRGLSLMKQVPELTQSSSIFLLTKAAMELSEGNLRLAQESCRTLLADSKLQRNMDEYIYAYKLLARVQEKLGKYDEALATFQEYKAFEDSIFEINQATSFAYYQTRYETEKKEVEILKKESEVKQLLTENKENSILFGITLVSLLGFGGFGFLFLNLKTERKKKLAQQRYSQELLKAQENERKRISKDLHDGLGQSLLLIKNKVALSAEEQTGVLLDTAIDELRAIARSLHPMQLEKLGLSKAIGQMLDKLDEETDIFISADLEEVDEHLSKETELQLYRISQEVLNNVLKHAQADALKFSLQKKKQKLIMTIADNGVGFDFSERYNDFQSLGLKTLKERTAAIGGQMNVSSEKGKGSKFEFSLHV